MPNQNWRCGKLILQLEHLGRRETVEVPIESLPHRAKVGDSPFHIELAYTAFRPGQRARIYLHPSKAQEGLKITEARLHIPMKVDTRVMCNGYQSWTETRLFQPNEKIPAPHPLGKWLIEPYGDYRFLSNKHTKGPHGWSYTYKFSSEEEPPEGQAHDINFVGSLDEFTAFTRFDWSPEGLEIIRDIPPLDIPEKGLLLFDLFLMGGQPRPIFEKYFAKMGIAKPRVGKATGWTSWYSEYNKISESLLLKRLEALREFSPEMDFFQIDDGWQAKVGDWLTFKKGFFDKGGEMSSLTSAIRNAGFKPGLWLAPFVCERKSALYQERPEWLLRDQAGKPIRAGFTPLWSGNFYALDTENEAFRDHLRTVFKQVFDWGFEMVKLDFLYAAAMIHRPGKTRAAVMRSAMELLRDFAEDAGGKLILGCGVPLASAFGLVEYCRIGADVHTGWEHKLLASLRNRERVSTKLCIGNTIARRHLNGLPFWNDPDVFQMRRSRTKLTEGQQLRLYEANKAHGGLLFHSDDPDELNANTFGMSTRQLISDLIEQLKRAES